MFDSPGLGADDVEEDLHNLQQILNLIKDLRKVKTIFFFLILSIYMHRSSEIINLNKSKVI